MKHLIPVALALFAQFGFAQSNPALRVAIPFEFVANNETFPSGSYMFKADREGYIQLAGTDGKRATNLRVITLLARTPSDEHVLSFDKIGEKRILSEVWLPARDGALVSAESRKHTHDVIKVTSAARR